MPSADGTPEVVTDWRQLQVGRFYELACKCSGLVTHVYPDPKAADSERGFYMQYINMDCSRPESLEESYRKGYGPYSNFFNYGLCDQAMPAREIPQPEWWDEAVTCRKK